MKKIVALVLSLVMVLGLATVAFAANTYTYANKDVTVVKADGTKADVSTQGDLTKYDAVKNSQTTNGVTKTTFAPAYYTFAGVSGEYYYECDKSVADYLFTIKGVGSVYVMMSTTTIDAFDATPATVYTAPKDAACDVVGSGEKTYVVVDGKYYGTETTGDVQYALVNGNMVVYDKNAVETAKPHAWADATAETYDAATGKVTSVKCPDCKGVFAVYTKAGAFDGKEYKAFTLKNTNDTYYYVVGAVANAPAVDTDKVNSAETFDAGIAMYVGMSVMAAAGSAVVLKKKD